MGWNKEKLVLSTWLPCTHVTAMAALCLPIAQGRMASARRFRPGKCAVNGYPSVTSCAWGVRMDVLLNLIKEDSLFFAHLYEYHLIHPFFGYRARLLRLLEFAFELLYSFMFGNPWLQLQHCWLKWTTSLTTPAHMAYEQQNVELKLFPQFRVAPCFFFFSFMRCPSFAFGVP